MADVTTESRDTIKSLRSALREARDELQTAVHDKTAELAEL